MSRRFALTAVVAIVAIAACGGRGPQAVGAQPSWRGSAAKSGTLAVPVSAKPVTFAPSGQPASRYNEPLQAPSRSVLGDAVIAAVREEAQKAGTPVPAADARLFRACAELSEIVPEEGIMPYSLVEFALHRNGIIEPSPHLLVMRGDIDSADEIVKQLRPQFAEILAGGATSRVGVGAAKRASDGSGAVVFALQGSALSTSPIPRQLKTNGSFTLEAVVDARYKSPEIFVTRDSGSTERVDLKLGTAGGFKAQVECGSHAGKQQVEILASDQQGSTVLANFPLWCGVEPPLSLTVQPSFDDQPASTAAEAEKRLFAMLNRDRQAAGLPALAWDDKVADVARGYSTEMRTTKIVAHISAKSGSAADRVRAAKIKTPLVLENVARAYGLGEAHQGLMNSPGHRANLMSASATHIGIGVVFGDEISGQREIFITQVFTRVPPKVDPTKAVEAIKQKLLAAQPVTVNPKLTAIAGEWAAALAAGKSREDTYPLMRRKVDTLGNAFEHVSSVITAASELDAIDGKALLGETRIDDVGVGVAQGPHPEIGEGAMWIVVLIAQRRDGR
jgi:uncharacterized protein YkwD